MPEHALSPSAPCQSNTRRIIASLPGLKLGLEAAQKRLRIFGEVIKQMFPLAMLESPWQFAINTLQIQQRVWNIESGQFDFQMSRLTEASEPYLSVIFHEWEEEHLAEFPQTFGDMQRQMVRAGYSAETAINQSWTVGDILPGIEGYLLRLKDNQPASHSKPVQRNSNRNAEIEQLVVRFLERIRPKYLELVPLVLQGDLPSFRRFGSVFGPTAMAARFANGNAGEANRIKTAIQKTITYKLKIGPLLKKPPMQPHGEGDLFRSSPDVNDILRNMRRQTEDRR